MTRFIPWLVLLCFSLMSCQPTSRLSPEKVTIGVVSYDQGKQSLEQYQGLQTYLAQKNQLFVEVEPVLNELKALEQIEKQAWEIVFAPPGLAAIAISQKNYTPVFSLQGITQERAVIFVRSDSQVQKLQELQQKVIALGQKGSATGYYLPLYDLYGLTLAQIRFAPTPRTIAQWVSQQEVTAGALSESEFELYQKDFPTNHFRILHKTRPSPTGVVLISSDLERWQYEEIVNSLRQANAVITAQSGYAPEAKIPNYEEFIKFVSHVKKIEGQIRQQPARLTAQP